MGVPWAFNGRPLGLPMGYSPALRASPWALNGPPLSRGPSRASCAIDFADCQVALRMNSRNACCLKPQPSPLIITIKLFLVLRRGSPQRSMNAQDMLKTMGESHVTSPIIGLARIPSIEIDKRDKTQTHLIMGK